MIELGSFKLDLHGPLRARRCWLDGSEGGEGSMRRGTMGQSVSWMTMTANGINMIFTCG